MKKLLLIAVVALFSTAVYADDETWTAVTISSGFNFDGICESESAAPTARGPLDTHGSQIVPQIVSSTGIPNDGALTLDNGHVYQFGNFTANNCLVLTKSSAFDNDVTCTSATLTFSSAVTADKLGFLVIGCNKENYSLTYKATVNYSDGTTASFDLETGDWGQSPSDAVYKTNRWRYTAGSNPETGFSGSICEQTIEVDNSKSISSVTFDYTIETEDAWGWGYINIFGVSAGTTTAGVNTVEAADNATVSKVYTTDGKEISAPTKGVNVIKYNNGEVRKVVVK